MCWTDSLKSLKIWKIKGVEEVVWGLKMWEHLNEDDDDEIILPHDDHNDVPKTSQFDSRH